jgi:hypothetical protein
MLIQTAGPRSLAFAALAALAVLATACVTVSPQTSTNVIGDDDFHTLTIDVQTQDIDTGVVGTQDYNGPYEISVEILGGPNAGLMTGDGVCDPSCSSAGSGDTQITWTYENNGLPGTDIIRVCFNILDAGLMDDIEDFIGGTPDEFQQFFIDTFCDDVTKTWVLPDPEPSPEPDDEVLGHNNPRRGRALGGFPGAGTSRDDNDDVPSAPASAPATAGALRAPSTGDAGLAD